MIQKWRPQGSQKDKRHENSLREFNPTMLLPFHRQVSLGNVMRHMKTRGKKRILRIIEGEEVLNAHHIICCGVKACSVHSVAVQSLRVQTSHVKKKQRELKSIYERDSSVKTREYIFWAINHRTGQLNLACMSAFRSTAR